MCTLVKQFTENCLKRRSFHVAENKQQDKEHSLFSFLILIDLIHREKEKVFKVSGKETERQTI